MYKSNKPKSKASPSSIALFFACLFITHSSYAKTVSYTLELREEVVNFTGKNVRALTVNHSLPAPTLEFEEGDDALITVVNHLKEDSSVHWHGLLVPNDQDGVPGVTGLPIKGGTSFTYRFPIKQSGTYWYHSHTGLQEQRGLYGAIVIHPKTEQVKADKEFVLVLSDWTDEDPEQVLRNLRTDGDYYALKKKTMVSWWDAITRKRFRDLMKIEKSRMGPMDLSDVGYDAFLSNGKKDLEFPNLQPGERLRLRVINAASSTYFHLGFAGGHMTVVSADGIDVDPIDVKQATIAVAETYDFIITVQNPGAFEFRATAQDVTGKTSLFIGNGQKVLAPNIPLPDLLKPMEMSHTSMGGMPGMEMGHHDARTKPKKENPCPEGEHWDEEMQMCMPDEGAVNCPVGTHWSAEEDQCVSNLCEPGQECNAPVLEPSLLASAQDTSLPPTWPTREIVLNLEGDMERYVWTINGKTLGEADKILVHKGENIRFKLVNTTMMHHPMHLHGHFFRVLNGREERSPLKHTVDVPPMGIVSIEFAANEEKDWIFHCHNLYHMASGMGRIVSYGDPMASGTHGSMSGTHGSKFGHEKHLGERLMGKIDLTAQTNELSMNASIFEAHQILELNIEYQPHSKNTDFQLNYIRPQNQFKGNFVSVGVDLEHDREAVPYIIAGIRRMLPYLFNVKMGVMSTVRNGAHLSVYLAVDRKIQLTDRVTLNPSFELKDFQPKFRFNVMYTVNPKTFVVGGYNSDNQSQPFGIGIRKTLNGARRRR